MPEQIIVGYDPQRRPIYAEVLSAEEIRGRMLESTEWKLFSERFDMSDAGNVTLLNAVFADKLGPDAELADYTQLLSRITATGGVVVVDATQFEFVLNAPKEVIEEPEVPRDKNGKSLNSAQLAWRQYAVWANDPSTTSEMIRQRRATDASFAEFYRRSLSREMTEGGVGDAVHGLNDRPQVAKQITPELQAWVAEYRTTPNQRVRQLCRADFNPAGYVAYNANLELAISAGLI
ncbi:MAG: hypothetical protein WCE87_07135 [Candidatus Udaeobacter sp.]